MMNNFQTPMQLIQLMRGGNPQQIAMNLLSQNAKGNPMLENVLNLASNGDPNGQVETIVRNICKQKNLDPDELMRTVRSQF